MGLPRSSGARALVSYRIIPSPAAALLSPPPPPRRRAWREGVERPFLLDNVWDVLRLLDYLGTRGDADVARVGVTGVSLGGMHAWLAAAADPRIAVAAPMIGVQNFG